MIQLICLPPGMTVIAAARSFEADCSDATQQEHVENRGTDGTGLSVPSF
jgi:hypothetical protein